MLKEKLNSLSKKELIARIKNLESKLTKFDNQKNKIQQKNFSDKKIEILDQENNFDIFNNSMHALYILDKSMKFIDVNNAAEKMYGYDRNYFKGKTPEFISAPKKNNMKLVSYYMERALNGEPQQFDFWGLRKNGEIFPKIVTLHKFNYFGNDAVLAYGIDITQRKKIEALLEKNEKYINSIFNFAPVGIGVAVNKIITKTNERFCKITGFTEPEIIGKQINKFFLSKNEIDKNLKFSSLEIKQSKSFETKIIGKDKKIIDVQLTSTLIDKNNPESGIIFSIEDITELKSAHENIKESEKKFRLLAENMQDVIWTIDLKGYFTYVSPSFKYVTEQMPEEIIGRHIKNFVYPNDYQQIKNKIMIFKKAGIDFPSWEIEFIRKNKNNIWVETKVSVLRNDEKKVIGFIGISRNINDRKKAEFALKESQYKYVELSRLLVSMADNIADMIWAKDLNGKYIFANQAICKNLLSAKNTKEPIGKNDMFFANRERESHPHNKYWHTFGELCMDSDSIVLKTKKPGRFDEFGNVKGKFLFLDVYKSPLYNEKGEIIGTVGSARDVTKEKEFESKLIESEEKFRSLFENMSEGVFYQSANGTLTDINKSALKIFGISKKSFIGSNSFDERWIVTDKNLKLLSPEKHPSMVALKTGKSVINTEVSLENLITKQKKWLLINAIPQFKKFEEKPFQVFVTLHDITENKNAEKLILENKEKFKHLFDNMRNGVAIYEAIENGKNFILDDINKAGEKLSKVDKKIIVNKKMSTIFPEAKTSGLFKICQEVYKSGLSQHFPYKVYCNGKIERWIDHYIFKLPNDQIVAIFNDASTEMKALEQLKESEDNLRAVLDASPDIIVLVNNKGKLLESNERLEKWLGLDRNNLIGSEILKKFDNEVRDIRLDVFKKVLQTKAKFTYKDKSNKRIWENTIIPILDEKKRVNRFAVYASDITDKELFEQKLKETNETLRNLSQHIINIREEERKNISREIHDNLSQILTAINMDVSWIKNLIPDNLENIKERFNPLLKLIDNSILTVQKISSELRPGILDDLGLVNAIEWQANEIGRKTNLSINLNLPDNEIELSEEKRIAVFRVFQESMSNIIRHSKAKNLKISLKEKTKNLMLEIIDDGIGIEQSKINDNKSLGLLGMKERILSVDGKINFTRNKKGGTTVKILIPIIEN
ncbi:MAG: PAS domain S-box protein [Ignavibacteriae bacterium]|nr:PAS domain S-box protein [Ignavibacteriota bacterium]